MYRACVPGASANEPVWKCLPGAVPPGGELEVPRRVYVSTGDRVVVKVVNIGVEVGAVAGPRLQKVGAPDICCQPMSDRMSAEVMGKLAFLVTEQCCSVSQPPRGTSYSDAKLADETSSNNAIFFILWLRPRLVGYREEEQGKAMQGFEVLTSCSLGDTRAPWRTSPDACCRSRDRRCMTPQEPS